MLFVLFSLHGHDFSFYLIVSHKPVWAASIDLCIAQLINHIILLIKTSCT